MATTRVEFETKFGKKAAGELALPSGTNKAPAVVLIQEWWGVNDHIRTILNRLADEGFIALAPDLYHGKVTKDPGEAGSLMQSLDQVLALEEIEAAATFLGGHPRAGGRVGIMGFCMGGMLTFRAAESISDFHCAVPFYGAPSPDQYNVAKVRAPILAHFAERDQWAKPEIAQQIQKNLTARGGTMTLHVYDADHAFFNDTRPEVHSPENAQLAWTRSVQFLHTHLD
ncbi:MAG: dienelactone hydrolase family protein [Polyangiaceae bacterium]|nr:dienelactone hydrolase family protein [Polyangiaceae bacterium]